MAALPNGEQVYNYCLTDWRFQKLFEGYLYVLVKNGEITEKFDSLTKLTASKIEKFIKEKVNAYLALEDANLNLQASIKEYEALYKLNARDFREKQRRLKEEFDNLISLDVLE